MNVTYQTKSPAETIELGKKLALRLKGGDVVLLYGELGSGKTHFIKGIAEGLGIEMTVKSPTYAYVNRFQISDFRFQIFYHYDLYRFEEGGDITSIGYDETLEDPKAINAVEWADRLGENLPERYIKIDLKGSGNERTIKIEFISPTILGENIIESYFGEWATPKHVIEHCRLVTQVAMKIAEAYMRKGEIINANLLYTACMLHDVNRVCDFKEMDRDMFQENVTDEKWEKWQACRNQFKGMHHADITSDILKERGFTDTAELVRLHKSINIVNEPDSYDTLERQIIYYADKRVAHNKIVDLKERFRDGKERYGKFDTPKERQLFDEVEKRTFDLEKRLFKDLDIKSEDI